MATYTPILAGKIAKLPGFGFETEKGYVDMTLGERVKFEAGTLRDFIVEKVPGAEKVVRPLEAVAGWIKNVFTVTEEQVPDTVEVESRRLQQGGREILDVEARIRGWRPAGEVYPEGVPEQWRLKPGEVTSLPVNLGGKQVKVPFTIGKTGGVVEDVSRLERLAFLAEGTVEESRFTAVIERLKPQAEGARIGVMRGLGRVDYEMVKVFQQGGMPDLVLLQEEAGMSGARFAGSPKIPVITVTNSVPVPSPAPVLKLFLQDTGVQAQQTLKIPVLSTEKTNNNIIHMNDEFSKPQTEYKLPLRVEGSTPPMPVPPPIKPILPVTQDTQPVQPVPP
ncbi:MAG: hypothetical protein ACP5IE_10125, partial [Infirmifilum sp.]